MEKAVILVIAGTNGAGKSSVVGRYLRSKGLNYYNPDEMAQKYAVIKTDDGIKEGNKYAWNKGFEALQNAIALEQSYNFETTLGGNSITKTLLDAAVNNVDVRMFYVGLESVQMHIERVQKRVRCGGHDIPEEKIYARFDSSRKNLLSLMPYLAELVVFDNSEEGADAVKILHVKNKKILMIEKIEKIPDWAKPILMLAIKLFGAN